MHYFLINSDNSVSVLDKYTPDAISRWDFKTFEFVVDLAQRATASTGQRYIPVDNGTSVSPRYDVAQAPQIGDKVSYSFNGDSYPDGEIVSIGKGKREVITTSTGSRYYRRKLTGSWKKEGGTWSLVHGHINERNPHF